MKSAAAAIGASLWMANESAKTSAISATRQTINVPDESWNDPVATAFATIQATKPETASPVAIHP